MRIIKQFIFFIALDGRIILFTFFRFYIDIREVLQNY